MTTTNNSFKTVLGFGNGYFNQEQVGMVVKVDAQAAFLGLLEIYARQTKDERATKGTAHKNLLGFSKREVTPGTKLAEKYRDRPEELTTEDVTEACYLAHRYRKQLWMIALGAVPENDLDLSSHRGRHQG